MNDATDIRSALDAEIAVTCDSTVYGRDHAREIGVKLVELFERRCAAEVTVHGDDAMVPASAWKALDLGNLYLRGGHS